MIRYSLAPIYLIAAMNLVATAWSAGHNAGALILFVLAGAATQLGVASIRSSR